jgi:hypothetical protein
VRSRERSLYDLSGRARTRKGLLRPERSEWAKGRLKGRLLRTLPDRERDA